MGKIYVGQTNLKLVLETGVDLTGATTKQIKYKKPTGDTISQLDAAVEGNVVDGALAYDFKVADTALLNEAGNWSFWAYVVFADGRIARGETANLIVYETQS